MIQVNEIRVGNWLQRLDGSLFQINSSDFIFIETINEKLQPNPIPLTEEWLVKFGFEKVLDGIYELNAFTGSDDIKIGYIKGTLKIYPMYEGFVNLDRIKYVYQLQNLYFALTGEELILKETT